MALFCEYEALQTESDVEQKLIYPLLSHKSPMGLGFKPIDIHTKSVLRQQKIGKSNPKYYYPDYLITLRGIPVLVIEAKNPKESLEDAYSEARLYAGEVNAKFNHGITVCQKIIVSNGTETWFGYADCHTPQSKLVFDDLNIENCKFVDLISFASRDSLIALADQPYLDATNKANFNTPVSRLGGKRVQNEELIENSYGRTLVFENRKIFDPESEQDKIEIVENAYVHSHKREQHIDPIYKEIKKIRIPSQQNAILLGTDAPVEMVKKISTRIMDDNSAYSLMLLLGNAGSGKSTFIRYFKRMFLEKKHPELAKKCQWIFLNMNTAPMDKTEVYSWIKRNIVESIKRDFPKVDFESYDIIRKLFRNEIIGFEKGIGYLLINDKTEYNKQLYNELSKLTSDIDKYIMALMNFLKGDYSSIPIVVLDNCDKRTKDTQLLMFEVA